MMTRIRTGTTVHSISMTVLCEVRVGTGLRVVMKPHDHVEQQTQDEES